MISSSPCNRCRLGRCRSLPSQGHQVRHRGRQGARQTAWTASWPATIGSENGESHPTVRGWPQLSPDRTPSRFEQEYGWRHRQTQSGSEGVNGSPNLCKRRLTGVQRALPARSCGRWTPVTYDPNRSFLWIKSSQKARKDHGRNNSCTRHRSAAEVR